MENIILGRPEVKITYPFRVIEEGVLVDYDIIFHGEFEDGEFSRFKAISAYLPSSSNEEFENFFENFKKKVKLP